jgi:hypothetical protein
MNLRNLGVNRPRGHALFPVGIVAILNLKGNRTTQRDSMPNAGCDLSCVLLDLHAPTTSVTKLAASHVLVEILGAQLQTGRKTL